VLRPEPALHVVDGREEGALIDPDGNIIRFGSQTTSPR
jgi:hypothetical protein